MNSLVKYRKVHHGSSVDESLFGARTKTSSRQDAKAVVISASELNEIRARAALTNEAEIEAERRARELREAKEKKCRERKEHMRRLELEAKGPKSDIDILDELRNAAIKKAAEEKIDENSDVVKLLHSLSSRAIAFTIRDKQLEEKKRREMMEEEYNRRMDMVMELDRLKDLRRREEEEKLKATKRLEDRKTITLQMEEKNHARLLDQEAKEQENIAMRQLMKKYELEEEGNAKRRKEEIELSKLEIIRANDDAIRRKRETKEREKKEVEEALLYMALKDKELARRETEERERETKKKEHQAKLLAQQERAQNNAGKLDELRARRAEEEKERQARRREREEALRRKEEMEKLLQSRAAQAEHKRQKEMLDRKAQEEELRQALIYEQRLLDKEREEDAHRAAMNSKHRKELEAQIVAEEERRRRFLLHLDLYQIIQCRDRMNNYENGSRFKNERAMEEERLKALRDKMVRDLEQKGVNPKYLSEMKAVDIGKLLRR